MKEEIKLYKRRREYDNPIKTAIETMRIKNRHTVTFLASEIGVKQQALNAFFNADNGSMTIAGKLVKYYNIKLVDILNN